MGMYFRRSLKIASGLRLNFSNRGIGVSAGIPGFRLSRSATGKKTLSAGVPGTGIRYRKSLNSRAQSARTQTAGLDGYASAEPHTDSTPGYTAEKRPARRGWVKFARSWLWVAVVSGILASFHNGANAGSPDGSAAPQLAQAAVSLAIGVILWFTRHPRARIGAEEDAPHGDRLGLAVQAKRSELQARIATLQDLQAKFSAAQTQPQMETAFLQTKVRYLDPNHPNRHEDDFGTLAITSRGLSFVSERTTQVWDFDKLANVIHIEGDNSARIFAVRNRQSNSGVYLSKDNAAQFDDYFRTALAVRHPDQIPGDVKELLAAELSRTQVELAALTQ